MSGRDALPPVEQPAPSPGLETPLPGSLSVAPTAGGGRGVARSIGATLLLFWRIMRSNLLTLAGFLIVVILAAMAVTIVIDPNVLPNSPKPWFTNPPIFTHPPSLQNCLPPFANCIPFGTDNLGVNLYSNILAALPLDLGIALFVSFMGLLIGGILGLIAGFWDRPHSIGAWISTFILRVTDLFLAFPSLVLALAVVAVLGKGVWQTTFAILFTWWPFYVRLVRGEVLAVRHLPYVTAARASGVSDVRIVLRHVLRNILDPIVVYFTLDIGTVIIVLSTISYIGVGVPYGIPEWGNLLAYYQQKWDVMPWAVLWIGFMIFVTVLSFSLLGDGLRDVLDPRSRRILSRGATVSDTAGQEEPELSPALAEESVGPGHEPTPAVSA